VLPSPDCLRLIAITDDLRDGVDGLRARAAAAVRGGATMIQLRLKDLDPRDLLVVARALVSLPVPVIVNDRADVALAAGAAGAHVGIGDIPAHALRRVAPPGFIIGASVGGDDEAESCAGADYVGIGPVFPTTTRAGASSALGLLEFARLARLSQRAGVPAVAIGGINSSNYRHALGAGASGVAVIRAIFAAADPERAARELSSASES
jgi:thiamine-phosphate pyrophosphorylase